MRSMTEIQHITLHTSSMETNIKNNTFRNVKTSGTLTVPAGSTGYDVWMVYLDLYGWTKAEQ